MNQTELDLSVIESSNYMRVLRLAVEKACKGEEIDSGDFGKKLPIEVSYLNTICEVKTKSNGGVKYHIRPDAFLSYLAFLEMKEIRASSDAASRFAKWSIVIAIASIALSIFVTLSTTIYQVWSAGNPIKLDESQLERIERRRIDP